MGFLNYWPLGLAVLVPVIIILYLLKQKTEPHPFPSLFLWRETYRNMHSDSPWEKLKKNLLMILQILTVIALIIALMSPYIRSRNSGSEHVIIVIDNSASMNTLYEGSDTRLDIAKRTAAAYIERLPSGTSISIIESNRDALLLLSDSQDKTLAGRRIRSIEPTNYAGSCEAGASMVRSMTSQWSSCEVACYTDTALSASFNDMACTVYDVYRYSENAYIEYVGHGRSEADGLMILAKITNDTNEVLTCDVNLWGDGKIISVSAPLNIPAKASSIVYFDNVDFDGNVVRVELNNFDDALVADNSCYDIISPLKECEALLLTERNLYLEKVISLMDGINVTKTDGTAQFDVLTANKQYDLYIFDGIIPKELPSTGNMIFIGVTDGILFKTDKELAGTVVHSVDSKLTGYIGNLSFGVTKALALNVPYWADTFLNATVDGETVCIGAFGSEAGGTFCCIGFDLHDTDLPLKLEFPVLIYNIMSYCAGTGMLNTNVINCGNTIRISSLQEDVTIKTPSGQTVILPATASGFKDTGELGAYSVSRQHDGASETEYFAVNFPKSESTAVRAATPSEGNAVAVDARAAGTLNLRGLIIILILILLCAEWIIYLKGL